MSRGPAPPRRLLGGLDEDPVEHGASRRVEGIHPGARADRDLHLVAVAVVEDGARDRWRAGAISPVQQAPARELEHAGAHQPVVETVSTPTAGSLDDGDPDAGPGQQQGGRRPGHAPADHDDVVGVHAPATLDRSGSQPAEQVADDVARVVPGAVDQAGVATVLEALADGVDAGCRR